MRATPRLGWTARLACAALLLGQVGCLDLALVADAAFPSRVPGLPEDGRWLSLPVRSWLTEPGLEAVAISACLPGECPEPAVVGLFRASGGRAVELERALDDPARLARLLGARARAKPAKPGARVAKLSVGRRVIAGTPGVVAQMASGDGTRSAAGIAVARRGPGSTLVLLVIAADEGTAVRLAEGAVPHLPAQARVSFR